MKTKYNLYASIASLCATLFLLVVIVMAWYVTNEEASATGITGSTAILDEESQGNVSEVYYFDITEYKNGVYTVGDCLGTKISNIEMGQYDALYSEAHQVLMMIKLKDSVNHRVTVNTEATSYLGSTIKDGDDYVLKTENNPISSIISFIHVNNTEVSFIVDENGDPVIDQKYGINFPSSVIPTEEEKSFVVPYKEGVDENKMFNDSLNQSVTISSATGSSGYIFIILDYVEDAIEDIYSKNIGNDALNGVEEYDGNYISYKCDFTMNIEKQGGAA